MNRLAIVVLVVLALAFVASRAVAPGRNDQPADESNPPPAPEVNLALLPRAMRIVPFGGSVSIDAASSAQWTIPPSSQRYRIGKVSFESGGLSTITLPGPDGNTKVLTLPSARGKRRSTLVVGPNGGTITIVCIGLNSCVLSFE